MSDIEHRIVINPRYRVFVRFQPGPLVVLVDALRRLVIRDEAAAHVFQLLKSGFSFTALFRVLPPSLRDPQHIATVVAKFLAAGVLLFESDSLIKRRQMVDATRGVRAFNLLLEALGKKPSDARSKLADFRVAIHSVVPINLSGLETSLQAMGMQVDTSLHTDHTDLCIVVGANYLSPEINSAIEYVQSRHTSCLLFSPVGHRILIGPLLIDSVNCWPCIRRRLALQDPFYHFLRPQLGASNTLSPPTGYCDPSLQFGFARLALDVALYALEHSEHALTHRILSLGVMDAEFMTHPLASLPGCLSCNPRQMQSDNSMIPFLEEIRMVRSGFQDQTAMLERAMKQLESIISPLTGIVASIDAIPCAYAESVYYLRKASYRLLYKYGSLADVLQYGKRQSSALGRSRLEADVKAGFEAVEHYSFGYQGTEPFAFCAMHALNSPAVSPERLLLFSEAQYANREQLNGRLQHAAAFIPAEPASDEPIHWCKAWHVASWQSWWIPMGYCYYGFWDDPNTIAVADSNGTAAGPDLIFCFENALYELVQRDAASIYHYNMLSKRGVDVHSWHDPYLDALIGIHQRLGRSITVLDISSDLPLFVFTALSIEPKSNTLIQGFGAHHDAAIALRQALQECCQMLPNVLPAQEGGERDEANSLIEPANDPAMSVLPVQVHHTPADLPMINKQEVDAAHAYSGVSELLDALEAKNIDVLTIDATRPETGISAVRVIAPGLRSWFPRFGAGRLYDVPVEQGELPSPKRESEMNPVYLLF